MVKGVDIPWIGRGSIYHGKGGQNTMGREGIQYILIIMGRGGNKISKFPKNLNFQKSSKFQSLYIMNLIFFSKLVSLRFPI